MAYVIAAPELMQAAAQDLASIRSSVAEAAATVAPSTTGIAAAAQDEISAAVASLFGSFGDEFQALTVQVQGFHQQFVDFMSAGANAYATAEAANASLLDEVNAFVGAVAAPYQALGVNTANNLQAIGATLSANPLPLLRQFLSNQAGYAQTIGSSIQAGITNLPAELANLPVAVGTGIQQLSSFNPVPCVQGFIENQISYGQTVTGGLLSAAGDIGTGVQALPGAFGAAFRDLLAGDNVGAYGEINTALVNAFLPGFNVTETVAPDLSSVVANIVPKGPLGDLAPILAIPGQMAQNFTDLLPAGSIPAQIAQNATNLVSGLTNFGTTITITSTANLSFGLPLQLVLDAVGAPVNALSALNSSAVAFAGAVQTGNVAAAAATFLGAPGAIANGFLNGTTVVSLPPAAVNLLGADLPSTTYIPLGGLLTPLSLPEVIVDLDGFPLPLQLSGNTPVGGLIPGLLSFAPQLAQLITPLG